MQVKAIRFEQTGGPEVLRLEQIELRAPGAHEVRVRHEAIGVNFVDTYQRTGLYPLQLPSGLGTEAAGVVEAVGASVQRFKVGERIGYCTGAIGAYAEANVINEATGVKLPPGISAEVAAASMTKGMTTRYLLRKTFRLERGQVAVIHAAAGGVGQIAVQWAKHLGATVIATVGSDAKVAIVRQLGVDHVIVTARENVAERVRALTEGKGAHVVYDSVGNDTWDASLDSLRPLGMMVSYGNASGAPPLFDPLMLARKGSLFLTRPTLYNYASNPADLDETARDLWDVIEHGAVKIAPPTRYALADAAQAHRDLQSRKTTGSLVLIP